MSFCKTGFKSLALNISPLFLWARTVLKIWYGDQFLFESNKKRGLLKNSGIITNVSETLNSNGQELRKNVALKDVEIYKKEGFSLNRKSTKLNVFVVLVNYGNEQIIFLERVVNELKSFKK